MSSPLSAVATSNVYPSTSGSAWTCSSFLSSSQTCRAVGLAMGWQGAGVRLQEVLAGGNSKSSQHAGPAGRAAQPVQAQRNTQNAPERWQTCLHRSMPQQHMTPPENPCVPAHLPLHPCRKLHKQLLVARQLLQEGGGHRLQAVQHGQRYRPQIRDTDVGERGLRRAQWCVAQRRSGSCEAAMLASRACIEVAPTTMAASWANPTCCRA